MGIVYEGKDETSGQRVAIKVLHAEISKHREVTLRFINEARAVNIVQHPNLVRTLHMGKLPNDSPYLVMEFLDGVSLGARLRESGGWVRKSHADTSPVYGSYYRKSKNRHVLARPRGPK